MTAEVKKDLNDPDVTFIDSNMQRRLSAFVTSVQVGATSMQQPNHLWLISESSMMHSTISILVLHRRNQEQLVTGTKDQKYMLEG